jgi:hypothetical protein
MSPISAISPTAVSATQATQPRDRRRPRPLHRLLKQDAVQALAAREQHLVMGEVLAEDDLDQGLLEAHLAQPLQVARRPRLAGPVEDEAAAQQQLAECDDAHPSNRRADPHAP